MRPEWIPTPEQEAMGITVTDLMREYPPVETRKLKEYWPEDDVGNKIPMKEWTVSDLAGFPDEHRDNLIREARKRKIHVFVELLEKMSPSEIAQDTQWANLILGDIIQRRRREQAEAAQKLP